MNDICIGVDLGTCYSSVGFDDSHDVQFIKDPAAAQLTYSIPSSALLRADNAYVFGELAESEKIATPEGYQREFKRDLGSSVPYRLRDQQVLAADLSAMFLGFLAELTTTTLTAAPAATVITVPAAYDQFRRSLIDDAARRAGLAGASLVAEPVAAAISAADRGEITGSTTVLVYDLGGGTFDAAVVRLDGGKNQVLGANGLADFGGTDIDVLIEQDFARKAGDEFTELVADQNADDPKRRARAQRARIAAGDLCRNIKHRLSSVDRATDVLNLTIQYELSRSDLEDMVRPHLDRTVSTCRQLLASIALTPEQIDTVLLTGGTSRMPLVREIVARELDRPVRRAADPELAVCIGATILADGGRKASQEAERKAKQAAARKAKQWAERKARQAAERKARQAAEQKTRQQTQQKAREQVERKARLLNEAERIARSIPTWHRTEALTSVAEALAETEPAHAARLFSEVERMTDSLSDEDFKGAKLGDVAGRLATSDPARAERIAHSITAEYPKAEALLNIARALAASNPAHAEGIISSIADKFPMYGRESSDIAKAMATTDPARAERIARSFRDYTKAWMLSGLAEALATTDPARSASLIAEAESIADSITNSYDNGFERTSARIGIAKALAATDPARAARLLNGLEGDARRVDLSAPLGTATRDLAIVLARTDPDRAERIAGTIILSPYKQDALIGIAAALAPTDPDRAERLARSIPGGAPGYFPKELYRASGLSAVAKALATTTP